MTVIKSTTRKPAKRKPRAKAKPRQKRERATLNGWHILGGTIVLVGGYLLYREYRNKNRSKRDQANSTREIEKIKRDMQQQGQDTSWMWPTETYLHYAELLADLMNTHNNTYWFEFWEWDYDTYKIIKEIMNKGAIDKPGHWGMIQRHYVRISNTQRGPITDILNYLDNSYQDKLVDKYEMWSSMRHDPYQQESLNDCGVCIPRQVLQRYTTNVPQYSKQQPIYI